MHYYYDNNKNTYNLIFTYLRTYNNNNNNNNDDEEA